MSERAKEATSLEALAEYSRGALVELPPFAGNQPFVVRIKRPSMLVLLKRGQIPNELLGTANNLFSGGVDFTKDDGTLSRVLELLDIMAEACFVEPTYQQIKDSGIELTDDQYMFIFDYSQKGVKALDSFRKE